MPRNKSFVGWRDLHGLYEKNWIEFKGVEPVPFSTGKPPIDMDWIKEKEKELKENLMREYYMDFPPKE